MTDPMKITDQLSVGVQPTADVLHQLSQQGFKSVVNLRAEGEEDQPLSPEAEAEQVGALGMEYLNLPVSMKAMKPELVNQFREALVNLPSPVYVHCHKGKRAGAMAMMHTACEAGHTGEQTLQMAKQMGFECDQPELSEFVKKYIDENRKTES